MSNDDPNSGGRTEASPPPLSDDYDGPWKRALQQLFEPFLALLFPEVRAAIDWSHPPEFLDKELQRLTRRGQPRTVDTLVRVRQLSGERAHLLVHVEVQAQREAARAFERRMFIYHYRLFDQDQQPPVSLAVLADPSPGWRPSSYSHEVCGCGVRMWYPVAKLKELEARWDELERSDSPFALVVMAHLKTLASRGQPEQRARWKLELSRLLVRRGFRTDAMMRVHAVIDSLMQLPAALQRRYEATSEEEDMPYTNKWILEGIEQGKLEGIEQGKLEGIEQGKLEGIERGMTRARQEAVLSALEVRFGGVPESVSRAVCAVSDLDRLSWLHGHAIQTPSLEAFQTALHDPPPRAS